MKPSTIGEASRVELPKYAEPPRCVYPSEQARRGDGDGEIKAEKFREGRLAKENRDKDGDGYGR